MGVRELKSALPATRQSTSDADVLIVEDNSAIADLYALKLRMDGFRVHHAADAATAEAIFEKTRPSIVCVDVRLPDASGFDAAPRFAEKGSTVILLTNDQESYEQPPDCVAKALLKSRITPSDLSAAVSALMPVKRRGRTRWP